MVLCLICKSTPLTRLLKSQHFKEGSLFQALTLKIMGQCHVAAIKAQDVSNICYKLLSNLITSSNHQGKVVTEELVLLADQSAHRYPVFTANGLFALNYNVMLGLAGSITTYVIIFLQVLK